MRLARLECFGAGGLVNPVVVANVNQDNLMIGDDHLQGDAVFEINRNTVEPRELSLQRMQAQRGMMRV